VSGAFSEVSAHSVTVARLFSSFVVPTKIFSAGFKVRFWVDNKSTVSFCQNSASHNSFARFSDSGIGFQRAEQRVSGVETSIVSFPRISEFRSSFYEFSLFGFEIVGFIMVKVSAQTDNSASHIVVDLDENGLLAVPFNMQVLHWFSDNDVVSSFLYSQRTNVGWEFKSFSTSSGHWFAIFIVGKHDSVSSSVDCYSPDAISTSVTFTIVVQVYGKCVGNSVGG
jgi:hypothetical protein